jgi:hypothetical protein
MNTLLKILMSGIFATGVSVILMVLYWFACYILIEHFKYNYGNENYWVFSHCFVILILSWILSFGYFAATIGDKL